MPYANISRHVFCRRSDLCRRSARTAGPSPHRNLVRRLGRFPTKRTQITFVLNWDGKNVTGIINPGPDSIPISSVFVDVTKWAVRIEADTKDKVHISAEGRIEDIGSYHRTIKGAWHQGAVNGDFRLTRD